MLNLAIPGLRTPGPVVHLADPASIQRLFAMDGVQGHAGLANGLLEPVTGPHSMLQLDGERHLRERRLLSPSLHGDALAKLERVVQQAAEREVDGWADGGELLARPAMQRITFQVIVEAVLGITDEEARGRLLAAFEPVFNVSPVKLVPALRLDVRWSPWGRLVRALDRLDAILYEIVAARRSESPRPDLLGLLIASEDENGLPLSDEHIRDELVTMLLAGHETTATALAWALERLAHHPGVVSKARDELAEGGEEYLDAIAEETLRVRPIVLDVGRYLSEEVEIAGYSLPPGTVVRPSIHLVHFDGSNYEDPESFAPDRFECEPPRRDLWLPFGGGRRRCMGAALAQMEMQVVLSVVLRQFRLEPWSSRPEKPRLRGITFTPEKEGRLRIHRAPLGRGQDLLSGSSYSSHSLRSAPVES